MNWLEGNFWKERPEMLDKAIADLGKMLNNFRMIQKFVFKDHSNFTADDFKYIVSSDRDHNGNGNIVIYRKTNDGENFWARASNRMTKNKGYKVSYYNDDDARRRRKWIYIETRTWNDASWEKITDKSLNVEYFPTKEEAIEAAEKWAIQKSDKANPVEHAICWMTYSFWKKREGLLQDEISDFEFYLSSLKTIKKYIDEM